jgi:hypothetical protein
MFRTECDPYGRQGDAFDRELSEHRVDRGGMGQARSICCRWEFFLGLGKPHPQKMRRDDLMVQLDDARLVAAFPK